MITGYNGQFFEVGEVAMYGSIFVFEGEKLATQGELLTSIQMRVSYGERRI